MRIQPTADELSKRLDILIEEFEKLGDGFVFMSNWVCCIHTEDNLQEACSNPCGTMACIAGKAGLMPRFRDMGFWWNPEAGAFCDSNGDAYGDPSEFFGRPLHQSVFVGEWCMQNIHTTQQAVIVLKAFRDGKGIAPLGMPYWEPTEDVKVQVDALVPEEKRFPVSGVTVGRMTRHPSIGYPIYMSTSYGREEKQKE